MCAEAQRSAERSELNVTNVTPEVISGGQIVETEALARSRARRYWGTPAGVPRAGTSSGIVGTRMERVVNRARSDGGLGDL
jgi:hypothetical protein